VTLFVTLPRFENNKRCHSLYLGISDRYVRILADPLPDTNEGTVFLNGDSFDVTTPLVLNDSGFQGSPLSQDPGDSFSGELFSFGLPSDLPVGQYIGSFEILGGADGGAQDTLGTVNFQVDVAPAVSAVPEPESLMMLAAGLPGVAVLVQRKWRQTSDNRG
jgi:PEP-CTERM motif